MAKKYVVILTESQRETLKQLITAGKAPARKLTRARVLLKADQSPKGPAWTDEKIAEAVEVSRPTIERTRKQFSQKGLEAALDRRLPRVRKERKLDGRQEAQLVTLVCSTPPKGRAKWTLRLLADKMVELEYADSLSYSTVRRTLKKTSLNPGARSSG